MALYLKYRPQRISELDITAARDGLYGLLRAGTLPHALLFTGVRGTGKTSSARILAKAINCVNRKPKATKAEDVEPCNTCDICTAITNGSSMDVIEIDAASHRGIDDIRDLREKVKLAPSQMTYKVYIIDEVHMLTTEAFNALLKTLEEPPKHVLFVLCTTEFHKLPDTILSRCHTISFRKASQEEIAKALKRVVEGEKLKISDEALTEVAKMAEGSFRDGTKYLEELSWKEGQIEVADVHTVMRSQGKDFQEFLVILQKNNARGAMAWLEEAAEAGRDMKVIARQLILALHGQLLNLVNMSEQGVFTIHDKSRLAKLIDMVDHTWERHETTHIPQLPLELAILEWMNDKGVVAYPAGSSQPVAAGGQQQQSSQAAGSQGKQTVTGNEELKQVIAERTVVHVDQGPSEVQKIDVAEGEMTVPFIVQHWEHIMSVVKPRNFAVEALLRGAKPALIDGDSLVLEVFYKFHFDQLQQDKSKKVVEQVLNELFGCDLRVKCQLVEKQAPVKRINVVPEDMMQPALKSARGGGSKPAPVVQAAAPNGDGQFRRRQATPPPVATEADDALVQFAAEIFGDTK